MKTRGGKALGHQPVDQQWLCIRPEDHIIEHAHEQSDNLPPHAWYELEKLDWRQSPKQTHYHTRAWEEMQGK